MGTPPPSQPPLRGAGSVWPPLLLSPHSPHILPSRSAVPPISLGVEVPHQHMAGTLVVGRCKLHVLPHCHLDLETADIVLRMAGGVLESVTVQ